MYDVYLGGVTTPEWRQEFVSQLSDDISVFDPYLKDFDTFSKEDKLEQIAREFFFMEQCDLIVFYFNSSQPSKSVRLQLGDTVGRDKREVIVCLDGDDIEGAQYVEQYCDYRGVIIVRNIEELVSAVEEYSAEIELCELNQQDD